MERVQKMITFFSTRERCSRWKWKYNYQRTTMIFQNPEDLDLFKKVEPHLKIEPSYKKK